MGTGIVMSSKTTSLVGTMLLLVAAAAASEEREVCPSPFIKIGTECYALQLQKLDWHSARAACNALAPPGEVADLAKLDSCDQHSKVWQYILMNDHTASYWLGGYDLNEEGFWHWVDGSPMDMSPPMLQWWEGNPSGGTDQNCLILTGPPGRLNDYICAKQCYSICQLGVSLKNFN